MLPFKVMPVELLVVSVSEDRTLEPPTTPPKLIAPEPALIVKSLAPFTVEPLPLNVTALFVAAKVIELPRVTAPV